MRFCGNCGTRLEQAPPSMVSAPAPVEAPVPGGEVSGRVAKPENIGQRRNVTILFVDLSGYTTLSQQVDNEDLYEIVQHLIKVLVNNVFKYGGTVDKITGDGLMALFGAPLAYENNAERALRSALDMRADVARLSQSFQSRLGRNLEIHIGLNAGTVIIGGVGSDSLMSYTAIGDTVNLASRLLNAANAGEILVSEAVHRQTRALFEFQKTPPLNLKGFDETTYAYRLIGSRLQPGSVRGVEGLHSPLIGRDQEMRHLMRLIDQLVSEQKGGFAMVIGEAGVGKSRLISELRERLTNGPVRILEGRSLTYRKTIAYWIFQDLLREFLGITQEAPVDVILQKISETANRLLGASASVSLPYLEYFLLLDEAPRQVAERIRFLDPSQLRQQLFLAVRDLLVAESHVQPLLLILEDLHWADEASLALIDYLLDTLRTSPIFICAISRPFEGGDLGSLQEHARRKLVNRMTSIPLSALPPEKSRELLESLLSIPDLPENLRQQIVQRAGGIPLYLEEILRKLIEDGVIYQEDAYWKLASGIDITTIGVPDTLQNLILDRFDRLEPLHRKILQTAAVIGQQFSLPILREVLKTVRPRDLESALSFLSKREFILPLPGIFEVTYFFKHVLVCDAIYGTLLRRDSRELHGKVGRAIEVIYADHLENQTELLANHYLKSAVYEKALHFAILTAQKAARGYANEQARQYFEQALALFTRVEPNITQVLQVHIGLGDVLVIIGEYQAARDHYQIALENIPNRGTEQAWLDQSILQRKIASSFERQGDFDKALARLYTAQQFLSQIIRPPDLEKARILNDIGWIHFRRGNLEEAERYLQDALALVVRSPQKDVIASIYNRLGGVFFRKEELERASQYTRQSLKLREEIGDVLGVARSYNNLGLLAYASGKWDEALTNYKKDLELQSRLGDAEAMAISHHNIGELQIDLGDAVEAQANLELSLEAAQQSGATFHIAAAHASLGRLQIVVGNYSQALNHLQESRRIFAEMGVNELLVDVYHLLGEAYLGLNDIANAQKWGNRSIDLVAVLGSRSLSKTEQHGRATRLLGKIALRQGDLETASRHLRTSLNVFKVKDSQLEQGRTLLEMGKLEKVRNQHRQARANIALALDIFQHLGAKFDLNHARRLIEGLES